jgi:lipoprotein-releasing system ATP-binding protein
MLTAHDVHKTYWMGRTEVPVLRGCALTVGDGEFVAVLGASGSGKSTLLHLLGGLDRPDRNPGTRIDFEGRAVHEMSGTALNEYRSRDVGFVFQFYHLLPELTALENVTIGAMIRERLGYVASRADARKRARTLLEGFGLGHRFDHRPAELSGGERQRVAIARALINSPRLVLADEPTGNLDRVTGRAILDLLLQDRHQNRRSMVLVTHDQEVAARADRVIRLADGRVEGGGEGDSRAGPLGGQPTGV